MKRLRGYLISLVLILPAAGLHAGDEVWQVGCARVEITPESSCWMAGYAMRQAPSEGVRMPLWAKALTLEDAEGNRGLILTMDILSVPKYFSDKIRSYAGVKYGLDNSRIILNSSHTHSGPVLENALPYIYPMTDADEAAVKEYTATLTGKILQLIDESFASMRPGRISTGCGVARIAVNRRHNPPSPMPTKELQGPFDHSVPVLKVEDLDGSLRTILFGYACHATTISDNLFSGDYPGFAQAELEKLYPGATAMFFQGCGADQNPLPRGKVSQAVQYGKVLANAVEQVLSDGMTPRRSLLESCYEEIPLAFDKVASKKELEAMAAREDYIGKWAGAMLSAVTDGRPFPSSYPYPIEYWTIGGQRVFILGGEVASGYSLALKERYGEDVFVMGYSNDVMTYIPTAALWQEHGYEVDEACQVYDLPSRWTPDVERTILEGIDKMLEKNNF